MRNILLIGMGPGHPDQITVQAIKALNRADVIFMPDKGSEKQALRAQRAAICAQHLTNTRCRIVDFAVPTRTRGGDYEAEVGDWHMDIAALYADLFARELGPDGCGAFLVWGDPTLYDSTLRLIDALRAKDRSALDYEIIPGVTSVQALAARHRVALNEIGGGVHITTGRRLAAGDAPADANLVIMLDGQQAFETVTDARTEIFWGAYLGMPTEIVMSGPLADVGPEIAAARKKARAANGWIFDSYILRKRP
jgi:precorrin-6A synthase